MTIIFILTIVSLINCQTNQKVECLNIQCQNDEFCNQGICNSCEGPRKYWFSKKPQWGTLVGEVAGVQAYSNEGDENVLNNSKDEYLLKNISGLSKDLYIGQKYQCVQYARKFWILKYNVTFGSIDTADEIFNLEFGTNILTEQKIKLDKYPNGGSTLPQFGDLLIWKQQDNSDFNNGHVAVVISVNIESEYPFILIAEQNYDQAWDKRGYSRALKVTQIDNGITVYNVRQAFPNKDDFRCRDYDQSNEGIILGWVRIHKID